METAQTQQIPVTPVPIPVGMPSQAQIIYAQRQYSFPNQAPALPGGFKVASNTVSYINFPTSSSSSSEQIPLRYVQQNNSNYNNVSSAPSAVVSSIIYNDNTNHRPSIMGRVERNDGSSGALFEYMAPKRPFAGYLTGGSHRAATRPTALEIEEDSPEFPETSSNFDDYTINNENWSERYRTRTNILYTTTRKPFKLRNKRPDSYIENFTTVEPAGPPIKRHKLTDSFRTYRQPLQVDTVIQERSSGTYNPKVEAISPTLPTSPHSCPPPEPEPATEPKLSEDITVYAKNMGEQNMSPHQISKLIFDVESEIVTVFSDAKSKANKPKVVTLPPVPDTMACLHRKDDEKCVGMRMFSNIFTRNWNAAKESHQLLRKCGPLEKYPLYNQASDTEIYHLNRRKYISFRPLLRSIIRMDKEAKDSRDQLIANTYNTLVARWRKNVEKVENSQKRKMKEAKNREIFEKLFPELRKLREDKERFSRSGGRIKSEADLEEIMDGLQEQELEDKKMRSYAVIPPLMLDITQKRYTFINNNGKIVSLYHEYQERQHKNAWSQAERDIFREKFMQHPKQFGIIAAFLERKTPSDCVACYYSSKKMENYKRLLRKSRQRTRTRNPHIKGSGANNVLGGIIDIFNSGPGVTTRLQREQIQQQQKLEQPQNLSTAISDIENNENVTDTSFLNSAISSPSLPTNPSSSCLITNTNVSDTINDDLENDAVESNMVIDTSKTSVESPVFIPNNLASSGNGVDNINSNDTCNIANSSIGSSTINNNNANIMQSESKMEIKKKERRKEDKNKCDATIEDTSEEEILNSEGGDKGSYPCAVCKSESTSSRALPKSHAQQYGLTEEDIPPGSRVCNLCRCKAVRSRYVQCPIPCCPNAKGNRVKRLRSLPGKWQELPQHIKQSIITEYQIPNTVTKCCSACFNRIQRKLISLGGQGDEDAAASTSSLSSQSLRWTDEETEALKRGISEHGIKWANVCQVVGMTKTQHQCKNFYFNFRKKLGLDVILQEYNKAHGGDERKPVLSSDEESGSSTSSCDELDRSVMDDSDTVSASSPLNRDILDGNRLTTQTSGLSLVDSSLSLINSSNENSGIPSGVTKSQLSDQESESNSNQMPLAILPSFPEGSSPKRRNSSTTASNSCTKEDYDSSATETADEGVGGSNTDNDSVSTPSNQPVIVNTAAAMAAASSASSECGNEKSTPDLNFKDLMSNVIEMQLMKKSTPPTLVTSNMAQQQQQQPQSEQLTKEMDKECEPVTLDLSLKKRDSPEYMNNHIMHSNQMPPSSMTASKSVSSVVPQTPVIPVSQSTYPPSHVFKYAHEPTNHYYHQQLVEVARVSKTGEPLYWKVPPGHQIVMQQHPLLVKQQSTHLKIPAKVSSPQQLNQNMKLPQKPGISVLAGNNTVLNSIPISQQPKMSGSIMHGTPVSSTNIYPSQSRDSRYESPILRQITPPHPTAQIIKESSTGSITQGTPVHQKCSLSSSSSEYYPQSMAKRTALPAPGFYPPRPHSYSVEQRQIIMNDYLTSQQISSNVTMLRTTDKPPYYYPARQGVIQRHNTNPLNSKSTSPHTAYPPGHEALGSLVDVAVRQPNLPIPVSNSSVTKDDKQRHLIQDGLAERFVRDTLPQQDRYLNREQERYMHPQMMHHEHLAAQQQLRENHLQQQREREREHREREMSQHELRDQMQHHYRDQQQLLQHKLREQERVREQLKQHPNAQQPTSQIRENHIQQQDYQRTPSSTNLRVIQEPHSRIQQSNPIYPTHRAVSSSEPPPDTSRIIQSSPINVNVNYHRESPSGTSTKQDTISTRENNRSLHQGESSTLTAASLIDAIITHQINQVNDTNPQTSGSSSNSSHIMAQRPADKLFQVFPEPNGKMSPLKSISSVRSGASPEIKSTSQVQVASQNRQLSPISQSIQQQNHQSSVQQQQQQHQQQQQQQHQQQHQQQQQQQQQQQAISSSQSEHNTEVHSNRSSTNSTHIYLEPQSWKLRRALQQKELEQNDRNVVRITGQMPPSPRQRYLVTEPPPVPLSPLDYVKNKIVEAMRTSEQDGTKAPNSPNNAEIEENGEPSPRQYSPATSYAYPYSALSINSQVPVTVSSNTSVTPKPVDIPESSPLLSSQYEPLSDED